MRVLVLQCTCSPYHHSLKGPGWSWDTATKVLLPKGTLLEPGLFCSQEICGASGHMPTLALIGNHPSDPQQQGYTLEHAFALHVQVACELQVILSAAAGLIRFWCKGQGLQCCRDTGHMSTGHQDDRRTSAKAARMLPYNNQGKEDTLGSKSRESPPSEHRASTGTRCS
eukprot:1151472-Pelagomonas_calceolata.AAC.1